MYRVDDLVALALALGDDGPHELALPSDESVPEGEWVLAIFEVGSRRKATAAPARTVAAPGGTRLVFEPRDWERLHGFATARSERLRAAKPISAPSPSADVSPHTVPAPPPAMDAEEPREEISFHPPAALLPRIEPSHDQEFADEMAKPLPKQPSGRFAAVLDARVLLVGDDGDTRDVVGAMLEAVGLTVEVAMTAEDALERLEESELNLLVVDWTLPGMTGLDFVRRIRREERLSALPVLFLSGQTSSRDIVEAFASGADDFVVKPFRAPELGARIFGLLRRARLTRPSPGGAGPAGST